MRVRDALGNEQSVAGIENDVSNQGEERVANQTRGATLDMIDILSWRGAARFNLQSPQQNRSAEKFDDAVDTKRFQQQTLRCPAEEQRGGSFDRHPADRNVRQQQRQPYSIGTRRRKAGFFLQIRLMSIQGFFCHQVLSN